jgi:DnaJ-class molecular chaperone
MFQRISAAYKRLTEDEEEHAEEDDDVDGATTVHTYKRMFETMYCTYSESFMRWLNGNGPELRLLRAMYAQLSRSKTILKTSANQAANQAANQDIVQTLDVSLEDMYRRRIKKVTVRRYRWSTITQRVEEDGYTVLVPVDKGCICFPDEGDIVDSTSPPGHLYFIIMANDDDATAYGRLFRDTQAPCTLRYKMHITPYDMCFGGGEYHISHYKEPIRLNVGTQFYKRCHAPVEVHGFGLWNPEAQQHDSLLIDITVIPDTLARRALFHSLYVTERAPPPLPSVVVHKTVMA